MNATVTLDKAGRVVIPKPMRDEMRLGPGDALELEAEGDRMTLRPGRCASRLRKERGIWVFDSGGPTAADDAVSAIREARERRDRHILGSE
ncbi:MAG: AbrB/MazE/SpoVT family DNA-binding domain-containing protein [Candidatus Binataceae bacterium]